MLGRVAARPTALDERTRSGSSRGIVGEPFAPSGQISLLFSYSLPICSAQNSVDQIPSGLSSPPGAGQEQPSEPDHRQAQTHLGQGERPKPKHISDEHPADHRSHPRRLFSLDQSDNSHASEGQAPYQAEEGRRIGCLAKRKNILRSSVPPPCRQPRIQGGTPTLLAQEDLTSHAQEQVTVDSGMDEGALDWRRSGHDQSP